MSFANSPKENETGLNEPSSINDQKIMETPKELAENNNQIMADEAGDQDLKNDDNKENAKDIETSSERSESLIKEIPLSGERNRFSRSKSPKPRWHTNAVENKEHSEISDEINVKSMKKRKWLGEDLLVNKKSTLTISSETLKSYLPKNPLDNLDKQIFQESGELDEQNTKTNEKKYDNNQQKEIEIKVI